MPDGRLLTRPYFKNTYNTYLRPSSGHAPSVHRSWPIANAKRVIPLCSTRLIYDKAMAQLKDRYNNDGVACDWDRIVSHGNPYQCPPMTYANFSFTSSTDVEPISGYSVLRYHPVLYRNGITRLVRRVQHKWRQHINDLPLMSVTWSKGGSHLSGRLEAIRRS